MAPTRHTLLHFDAHEYALYLNTQTLMWSQVVTGLATLQDAIQTLSSAYIKHTNAVLGDNGAAIDINTAMNAMNGQFNNPLLGGSIHGLERPASPTNSVTGGEKDKKERKKRLHDPNAPKRPLTAYFLFMQTARPIIAQDLGEETTKGAISKEGTTRWTNMTNGQKRVRIPPSPPSPSPLFQALTNAAMDRALPEKSPSLPRPHARL